MIEPQIQAAELARARRERPGSVAAYDIYLQARARILAESPAENAAAFALLSEALALDPDNPRILAHAAWAIEHRTTMGWPPFGPDDVARCAAYARRALELADGDAAVMAPCGIALLQAVKDYDWGLAVLRAAAEANPNDLVTAIMAGVGEMHCGSLDAALAHAERALRLSPRGPHVHFSYNTIADVADDPRQLCRGRRVGVPGACAQPQLRRDALEPHRRERASRADGGGAPLSSPSSAGFGPGSPWRGSGRASRPGIRRGRGQPMRACGWRAWRRDSRLSRV